MGSRRGRQEAQRVLALDVGSTSVRCRLFDADARGTDPGPDSRVRYAWNFVGGAMEIDARRLLEHVFAAIDAAVVFAREQQIEIVAIGVTTFWHSLLALDRAGQPIIPLTGWGDARATTAADRLRELLDEREMHRRTGCFIHASYPFVRLAWLRESNPALRDDSLRWASFAEFLEIELFGTSRCTYSMASASGLLDVHRLEWDEEALEVAGVRSDSLSPLADAYEPLHGLREVYASRWPELSEVPWFPAAGDGACANLGSGATGSRLHGVTIGTSAAVRVLLEPDANFEIPEDLWAYRLDARRWVVGGALSNGGNALSFLKRTLRLPEQATWDQILATTVPDAHGLAVLPSLVAPRISQLEGLSGAVISGLMMESTAEELVRAWLESIAYQIGGISGRLAKLFGEPAEVRASGGALRDATGWTQMIADVLGLPVTLPREREETSRGAALLAMRALGWHSEGNEPLPDLGREFYPDEADHEIYQTGMRRQRALRAAHRGAHPAATTGAGNRVQNSPDGS